MVSKPDSMVAVHGELGWRFLEHWTVLSLQHQLYVQPCSLCVMMVTRCCESVEHCNNAAEVTCVIWNSLTPDEHLDEVDSAVVPDPECRCPSSLSQDLQLL